MEEIKQEILSLSDKYSVKCVESAALEERLAAATAQLAHAHNHIMQLDARYVAYKVMGRPLRESCPGVYKQQWTEYRPLGNSYPEHEISIRSRVDL